MNCQDCETLILDDAERDAAAAAISAHPMVVGNAGNFATQQALRHLLCKGLGNDPFACRIREQAACPNSPRRIARSAASGNRVHGSRNGSIAGGGGLPWFRQV